MSQPEPPCDYLQQVQAAAPPQSGAATSRLLSVEPGPTEMLLATGTVLHWCPSCLLFASHEETTVLLRPLQLHGSPQPGQRFYLPLIVAVVPPEQCQNCLSQFP